MNRRKILTTLLSSIQEIRPSFNKSPGTLSSYAVMAMPRKRWTAPSRLSRKTQRRVFHARRLSSYGMPTRVRGFRQSKRSWPKIRAISETSLRFGFNCRSASATWMARVALYRRCRESPGASKRLFPFRESGAKAWSLKCEAIKRQRALHFPRRATNWTKLSANSQTTQRHFVLSEWLMGPLCPQKEGNIHGGGRGRWLVVL